VLVTVFHLLAILTTVWRLLYRVKKHSWWWEDAWATIALAGDIASLISVWIVTAPPGPGVSDELRIVASWTVIVSFTICLWSARLSIICSVIRLSPRESKLRKVALVAAAGFGIMFLSLLFQKVYYCAHDTWWYSLEQINCHLGTAVSIPQLATDVTSDIILVALPVHLMREVNVPRDRRILVLSVFSSSILISLISAAHFVFMIEPNKYFQILTAQLEISLSVVVCDLLVIVTCAYRILRRRDLDLDQGHAAGRSRTVYFTTVIDITELATRARSELSSAEDGSNVKVDSRELQGKSCSSFAVTSA
ncbi:hypothetical protein HYDPIDRAFT_80055, partial [Hydnomerulius pinastri MD-312]